MTRSGFALLLLLVVLTRLPFLWSGYGTDPDAWRVADVATRLWHTGVYEPSRLPGNPLHEILTAPLASLGDAPISNAATLVCSLILLCVWHRIVQREARYPALLVIVLAFTPLLWKNSAVTMDYLWSLLFIMLAFDAALRDRAVLAGIMAGLAAGFRPANALAAAALMVPLLMGPRPLRASVIFVLAAAGAAMLALMPLLATLGLREWLTASSAQLRNVRITQDTGVLVAAYRAIYAIGPLAVLAIGWIVMRGWGSFRRPALLRESAVATAVTMVFIYGASFVLLPMEREYLLPALPFLLLLVDRLSTRRQVVLTAAAIISFAFINPDVVAHEGTTGRIQAGIRPGMVIEDLEKARIREEQRALITGMHAARPTIVLTGFPEPYWFADQDVIPLPSPLHEQLYRNRTDTLLHHTFAISHPELLATRARGFDVVVLRGAERFIEQTGGFSIAGEGLRVVPAAP